jgi:hypothetical protein
MDSPFVRASITPLFSRYFLNSSFLESGVYRNKKLRNDAHSEERPHRFWHWFVEN